jgi:hypothetical protein
MDYILISGPLVTGQPESCADVTAWSDLLAAAAYIYTRFADTKKLHWLLKFHSLCQSRPAKKQARGPCPARGRPGRAAMRQAAARPGPGSQGLRLVSQSVAGLRLNLSLLLVGSAAALASAP